MRRYLRKAAIHAICTVTVLLTRVGLWTMRYQTVHKGLVRPCSSDPQPHRRGEVVSVTRATARMARIVPDAKCLTQSIACQAVLSWRGIPSTIAMGVRKGEDGVPYWHAWLVWNETVVLQGNEATLAGFSKLLDLPTPDLPTPSR